MSRKAGFVTVVAVGLSLAMAIIGGAGLLVRDDTRGTLQAEFGSDELYVTEAIAQAVEGELAATTDVLGALAATLPGLDDVPGCDSGVRAAVNGHPSLILALDRFTPSGAFACGTGGDPDPSADALVEALTAGGTPGDAALGPVRYVEGGALLWMAAAAPQGVVAGLVDVAPGLDQALGDITFVRRDYVTVLDGEGRVAYGPDGEERGSAVGSTPLAEVDPAVVERAWRGPTTGPDAEPVGVDGFVVAGGAVQVPGSDPWGVVVAVPDSEVFASGQLDEIDRAFLLFMVVALVVGVIAAAVVLALILRGVFRPLDRLVETMRRFGSGDLSARAAVTDRRRDEMNAAARAFNDTAQRLEELYRELESRVSDRTKRLASSERRFRQVVESAPDATIVVDAEGRIVQMNRRVLSMFGYPKEELVGRLVETLMPGRYRRGHVEHRAGFMGAPQVREMGIGLELAGQRKDGSEFPVEISLSPIDTPEGVQVIAAVRDVTERREAEAAALALAELRTRQRQAVELNDNVVQGLTVAKWSMEEGDAAKARQAVDHTLDAARALVAGMLGEGSELKPGDLVRERPVEWGTASRGQESDG